jgi:hypothetical protein
MVPKASEEAPKKVYPSIIFSKFPHTTEPLAFTRQGMLFPLHTS